MMVRQASTVADLWMSNTKSGFLMRLTQNLRNRLQGGEWLGYIIMTSLKCPYYVIITSLRTYLSSMCAEFLDLGYPILKPVGGVRSRLLRDY